MQAAGTPALHSSSFRSTPQAIALLRARHEAALEAAMEAEQAPAVEACTEPAEGLLHQPEVTSLLLSSRKLTMVLACSALP